ncbi:hypothetical protein [Spiroplasma sp. AdecLV25b]|uniref:hypothetical protein n=1 Tax=Spiroplasma sp. AdecLV25b TaxID=3027162 RepID=UPI0027DFDDB4|nr:hypothetical protein [Spiroplasma sp. AdecLV25b]
MKRILKMLSICGFTIITPLSTTACSTSRTINSLESPSGHVIKATNPPITGYNSTQYSDITYWSNDSISSSNYKNIFMENLNANLLTPPTNFDYYNMANSVNGKIDKDAYLITGDDTTNVNVAMLLLAKYELNSTKPKITNIKDAYNQYNKDFKIDFYQQSSDIPTNKFTIEKIENKYNPGITYKLSFLLSISVTDEGNKDGFVGARKKVVASKDFKTDISENYQEQANHQYLIDTNDSNLTGYNKTDNKVYYTNKKDFDYRFAIDIVFTVV